jgi:hypothetical protein
MRRYGIPLRSAREQLQRDDRLDSERFYPLPAPTGAPPYALELSSLVEPLPEVLAFHVIGDHGGVRDPNPQLLVAAALQADNKRSPVAFCYSLGDIVYFNGAECEYPSQFYEPYAHYPVPILAIPGNHDGDPLPGETSLAGFVANFCSVRPELPRGAEEFGRETMTLPNCYWTLEAPALRIIGLYSNVPSGGEIDASQREWFTSELARAPKDAALIVALHHPPYSVDAHHGGSARMGALLDKAFEEAGRYPDLVLAGHVHNYQRFTRVLEGHAIAYIVCGNGGYHHLHPLAHDAEPGSEIVPGLRYEAGDAHHWGFLRLELTAQALTGTYTAVCAGPSPLTPTTSDADEFSIPLRRP